MKTTFDIENAVFAILNVTAFKALFTGTLYNGRRPVTAAVSESVVVSSSTVDNGQVQSGLVSVKCWAKDIGEFTNVKLGTIISKTAELVESASVAGFEFETMSSYTIADSNNPGWSIGIVRIECYIKNL